MIAGGFMAMIIYRRCFSLQSLEQQLHVFLQGSRQSHDVPSAAKTSGVSFTSSTSVYNDGKSSTTEANMDYLASLTVADVS